VCDGKGVCVPFEDICQGYSVQRDLIVDTGVCLDDNNHPNPNLCGFGAIFKVTISNICGKLPPTAVIREKVEINGCGFEEVPLTDRETGTCNPPCQDTFSACFPSPLNALISVPVPSGKCLASFTQTLYSDNCSIATNTVVFNVTGNGRRACSGTVINY